MRSCLRSAALSGLVLLVSFQASAIPTAVVGVDTPQCDVLSIPANVHELGTGANFTPGVDQIVSALLSPTGPIAAVGPAGTNCNLLPAGLQDSPFQANHGVAIVNTTGTAWQDLWWVADANTVVSNNDGAVNGFAAFKIDQVGVSKPLISESILTNGIFDIGETWAFMLQDWTHSTPGFFANQFGSIGVGAASGGIGDLSTGSIVGVPVPEPGTAVLLALGLVGLARARKSA